MQGFAPLAYCHRGTGGGTPLPPVFVKSLIAIVAKSGGCKVPDSGTLLEKYLHGLYGQSAQSSEVRKGTSVTYSIQRLYGKALKTGGFGGDFAEPSCGELF
jgi:hypothetical protein